jgi:hypothetical protein
MNHRGIQLGSLAAAATLLVTAAPSMGKGGDNRVQRSGSCSGTSTWKLKAKPDNGRLETEFEVDQNRTGVVWHVTIRRNGRTGFSGSRTTSAPSGSLSVARRLGNSPGSDKITALARRAGETCSGSLTI